MTALAALVVTLAVAGGAPTNANDTCPAEIAQYGWPVAEACAISWCESRWQADAFNSAGPYIGLFQVWASHTPDPGRLFSPEFNVAVAYALWRKAGWQPWGCRFVVHSEKVSA